MMASSEPFEWLEVFAAITQADADGRYPDFEHFRTTAGWWLAKWSSNQS